MIMSLHYPPNSRCGFGMVELMVVIAIVAILIAVLLPTASLVRQAAQRTSCAANMSQCGKAFMLYAANNGGFVPRGATMTDSSKPPWTALIAKELGLRSPFSWADVAKLPSLHCVSHVTDDAPSHYVINAFSDVGDGVPAGLTRLSSIRNSSSLPWLLETPPVFGTMTYYPVDDIYVEYARFVSAAEHLVGGAKCRLGTRNHGVGKSNVLFADGHVETKDNSKLRVRDFLIGSEYR